MLSKIAGKSQLTLREREALDFASRLATDHTSIDEKFMAGMREHFTDPELIELGLVTGAFILLGRLHYAFGVAPAGSST